MAIDEKKAILRGLSVTAQAVREEATAPKLVAEAHAAQRRADRTYQAISNPLLLISGPLAMATVAWELARFYHFGAHWGIHHMPQMYVTEGSLLFAAGLLLCLGGFGLLYLFRDTVGKRIKRAAIVMNIIAVVIPLVGLFFLSTAHAIGRRHAYARLDYFRLADDAGAVLRGRDFASGAGYSSMSTEWHLVPSYTRGVLEEADANAGPPQLVVLDKGVALLLDEEEGLLIPVDMSTTKVEGIAAKNGLTMQTTTPAVIRFEEFYQGTPGLQDVLNETSKGPAWSR